MVSYISHARIADVLSMPACPVTTNETRFVPGAAPKSKLPEPVIADEPPPDPEYPENPDTPGVLENPEKPDVPAPEYPEKPDDPAPVGPE